MAEQEYVARVVVERMERQTIPSTRPRVLADKTQRVKFEVASFAVRSSTLRDLRNRVQGMMDAALPDSRVEGEPKTEDGRDWEEDEDEEEH